jgi:hypothetical protein
MQKIVIGGANYDPKGTGLLSISEYRNRLNRESSLTTEERVVLTFIPLDKKDPNYEEVNVGLFF